jgi:hypothetical protein
MEDFLKCCRVEVPDPDSNVSTEPCAPGGDAVFEPTGGSVADPVSVQKQNPQQSYSQMASKRYVRPAAPKIAVTKPPVDPKLQAFQDAVKHSERSTLIFNLDLGRHKTLNANTILRKATVALSEAAAEVEGNKGKPPSKEAISALDDVISVTENVTLFGKVTKPYVNKADPKDPKNRTFFTLPVRYDFKDRDTKNEAERILRDTCKIECTTPYPIILRHCIRHVIDHMRKEFPGDFIKVTVDSANRSLNVSRRKKGEGWFKMNDPIKLPVEVLDVHAYFVPEGLVMNNLPKRKTNTVDTSPTQDKEPDMGDDDS